MTSLAFSWIENLELLESKHELSKERIQWSMREILEGRADISQIKAFLLALKTKGESAQDVGALVEEMYRHAAPITIADRAVDTVGTGGDVAHTINISTTAAIIAAAAGARVVKHGNRAATSRSGAADLLEALGVAIMLNGAQVEECVKNLGIGFCFAPMFHPAMRHAGPARKELGVPTVFNILGPLANPARPQAAAIGVASEKMLPVMAEVLAKRGVDGFVFRGDDGLDEITLTTSTTMLEIVSGDITYSSIDPKDFGINHSPLSEIVGGDPQENARITTAIFAGERGAPRDCVVLTAAATIAAYRGEGNLSVVERMSRGVIEASAAIDNGGAANLLSRWIELSQKLSMS
ncbi:MAG: anthranilate phosphoribosyltransferase [Actinobacteria bacterium]|nr:anthranilate phosphoribosyltransferase [Actinomycetota bacterium]